MWAANYHNTLVICITPHTYINLIVTPWFHVLTLSQSTHYPYRHRMAAATNHHTSGNIHEPPACLASFTPSGDAMYVLTHWGRVTHICVGKLTIIGSNNGLPPVQAIIWTNAGKLLIGPLGTNFSEILIGIQTYSFTKMHLKMSSAKWRSFCLGLNVLISPLTCSTSLSGNASRIPTPEVEPTAW